MFNSLVKIFTVVGLLWAQSHAQADVDEKSLAKFGGRHRSSLGTLLNPSIGSTTEIRAIETALREILLKLSPDLFTKYNLSVGIYASGTPNAFMEKLDAEKKTYHLGVTLGLLRTLKTVDQLAFVLGHELTHLFEGHVELNRSFSVWWSAQRHESIADHKSIQMMVGNFEISGALDALWKLAELQGNKGNSEFNEALAAVLADHHDPSVRIGMAQAYIEYLRKTDSAARIRLQKDLASFFKIYRNPRNVRIVKLSDVDIAEITKGHRAWLEVLKEFRKTEGGQEPQFEKYDKSGIDHSEAFDRESILRLVKSLVSEIVSREASPEEKIANLLDSAATIHIFDGNFTRQEILNEYSRAIQSFARGKTINYRQLADFLKKMDIAGIFDNRTVIIQEAFWSHLIKTKFGRDLIESSIDEVLRNELKDKSFGGFLISLASDWKDKEKERPVVTAISSALIERLNQGLDLQKYVADNEYSVGEAYQILRGLNRIREAGTAPRLLEAFSREESKLKNHLFSLRKEALDQLLSQGESRDFDTIAIHLNASYVLPFTDEELAKLSKIYLAYYRSIFEGEAAETVKLMFELPTFRETVIENGVIKVKSKEEAKIHLDLASMFKTPLRGDDSEIYKKHLADISQFLTAEDIKEYIFSGPHKGLVRLLSEEIAEKRTAEKSFQELEEGLKTLREKGLAINARNVKKELGMDLVGIKMMLFNQLSEVTSKEFHRLYALGLLSAFPNGEALIKSFTVLDLNNLILTFYRWNEYANQARKLRAGKYADVFDYKEPHDITNEVGAVMLDIFMFNEPNYKDFVTWAKTLRSILRLKDDIFELRADYKEPLEKKFLELSQNGKNPAAYQMIQDKHIRKVLTESVIVPVVIEEFARRLKSTDITEQRRVFDSLDTELKLKSELPDIFNEVRKTIAEKYKLQPQDAPQLFPREEMKIDTESTKNFSSEVRYMSAIAGYHRQLPVEHQIELIEYLMGRTNAIPNYIVEKQKKTSASIVEILYSTKLRLSRESELNRAFFLNGMLAGPLSAPSKPEMLGVYLNHLTKNSSDKKNALLISTALMKSLGRMNSMALAYVLAAKPKSEGQALDEGQILKNLFEAFGVAGVKLGQYLGFTSEMKNFQKALAELQDSAMPISYLQMLELIQKRLGDKWDTNWEVIKILGTGSVNVAIEIKSKKTGEVRVISVLREDIETASQEDFRKLQEFVAELYKSDERYSFLSGLLDIIRGSVQLEFNKENSFQMQKYATDRYKRDFNSWKLQSIEPFRVLPGTLEMEKAPGKTARKIRERDFELYKKVMGYVLQIEVEHLMNATSSEVPAFANPDLHDGQVLIDVENKTVSILDFGQAVEISRHERDLGLDFVRLMVASDQNSLSRQIQALSQKLKGKPLPSKDIEEIFKRAEAMDRFVYTLGVLSQNGNKVPLSTVHFVLGVNRAIKLGENIGYDLKRDLKVIIATKVITNSTELGYHLNRIISPLRRVLPLFCRQVLQK